MNLVKSLKKGINKAWPWRVEPLSKEALAVSESIKALKTLRFENGRVSIDPSEVLGQPGYLAARAQAGELMRATQRRSAATTAGWHDPDELDVAAFSSQVARSLMHSRRSGLSLDEAITELRKSLMIGEEKW